MALTAAQVALCAAIFGTAGYHAPPVVKIAKAHVAKAQGKPKLSVSRPRVVRPEPAPSASPVSIPDCPIPGVPAPDGSLEYRLEPMWSEPWPQGSFATAQPPIGGGFLPPIAPRVPEPGAWVMLIAGFGFVGLSLRKRKDAQDA
jgi:hypothetical protein